MSVFFSIFQDNLMPEVMVICVLATAQTTCIPSCKNGGICHSISTLFVCQCPCGWTGQACDGNTKLCVKLFKCLSDMSAASDIITFNHTSAAVILRR